MKKIIIPIVVVLISGLIVINFISFKSPSKDKMISQLKTYSINQTNNLNINLYANRKTAYQTLDAIDISYISDLDESKKLQVELNEIIKLDKYKYLDDSFTNYLYKYSLPTVNSYFYIDEAFLTIRLKSGEEQTFPIGSLDYYLSDDIAIINELYGSRFDDFPALESISFNLSLNEDIYIERIHISNKIYEVIGKEVKNNELIKINLSKQTKISDQLTIKIVYFINTEKYELYLPYYLYYETNENPLLYRSINNVTILN